MKNSDFIIKYNANASKYTTFQLGGPCKGIVTCETPSALEEVLFSFNQKNEKFIVIGRGSNLLFSDKGIDCYVVRFINEKVILNREGNLLEVSAGTMLDHLVEYTVSEGLDGLVALSGIPGTLGGAVVGNAGAFGQQVSDHVLSVEIVKQTGEKKVLSKEALQFSYRNSFLKYSSDIVLNVTLSLSDGIRDDLLKQRREILSLRKEKHPDYKKIPSAGSFFRNIGTLDGKGKRQSAGLLLEQVNAKEMVYGGAAVFKKHANIIIKNPNGKSQDIYELSKIMAQRVSYKFGIDLIREVRFVGKFEGMPDDNSVLFW